MSRLLGIPVPDWEQIIIGAELVVILYPIRLLAQAIDKGIRKERNRVIHIHVKTGHKSRLKHCIEDGCASLRNLVPLQAELALPPELEPPAHH